MKRRYCGKNSMGKNMVDDTSLTTMQTKTYLNSVVGLTSGHTELDVARLSTGVSDPVRYVVASGE